MQERAMTELDELLVLVDDRDRLEQFFAQHREFFCARVRRFFGERDDVDEIAFELMRLELASIVG
jgi:hypothetical protein